MKAMIFRTHCSWEVLTSKALKSAGVLASKTSSKASLFAFWKKLISWIDCEWIAKGSTHYQTPSIQQHRAIYLITLCRACNIWPDCSDGTASSTHKTFSISCLFEPFFQAQYFYNSLNWLWVHFPIFLGRSWKCHFGNFHNTPYKVGLTSHV